MQAADTWHCQGSLGPCCDAAVVPGLRPQQGDSQCPGSGLLRTCPTPQLKRVQAAQFVWLPPLVVRCRQGWAAAKHSTDLVHMKLLQQTFRAESLRIGRRIWVSMCHELVKSYTCTTTGAVLRNRFLCQACVISPHRDMSDVPFSSFTPRS